MQNKLGLKIKLFTRKEMSMMYTEIHGENSCRGMPRILEAVVRVGVDFDD